MGSAEGGHPDLLRFPRFLPICSDFRFLFSGMPRFVPICSVFFRFVPITNQNKSEQIRETPFCRPLLQIPDWVRKNPTKLPAKNKKSPTSFWRSAGRRISAEAFVLTIRWCCLHLSCDEKSEISGRLLYIAASWQ